MRVIPSAKRRGPPPSAYSKRLQDVTLTVIELPYQTICHVTPLNPVQLRILEILGFSSEVYTRLEAVSVEPP